MKVIAFNCDLNKDNKIVDKIFSNFLEGMKEANADIEYYSLSDLDIKPCRACTTNIGFIPNLGCQIQDSMQELYPKIKEADAWVFLSPSYNSYAHASFKNLLDRLEPIFEAPEDFGIDVDDIFYRSSATPGKLILIAVTEKSKDIVPFGFIVEQMRMIADIFGKDFLTPILRDNYELLDFFEQVDEKVSIDIYDGIKEAGKQAVLNNDFDEDTIKIISRNLTNKDSFITELTKITEAVKSQKAI